jgi:hypothetical protein
MRRTQSLGVGLLAFAALSAAVVSPLPATALVTVGGVDTPGFALDVEVVGGLAYVAYEYSGLRVIDVSDPKAPVEIGALDTPGQAFDVEGGLAYVANIFGLRVIDLSDPTAPVELGAVDTPGPADGVEVVGGVAYVADWDSGLRVIDVSDPAAPVESTEVDEYGYPIWFRDPSSDGYFLNLALAVSEPSLALLLGLGPRGLGEPTPLSLGGAAPTAERKGHGNG